MATKSKKRAYYDKRYRANQKEPVKLNVNLLAALTILLLVLLMKKYDYSVAGLNIDTLYDVVYDSGDFNQLKGDFNESFNAIR